MWFAFGFITLFGFSIYIGRQRYLAGWKGKTSLVNGITFDYRIDKNRGKALKVKIGFQETVDLNFRLKPETRIDRLFKATGLAREYQTRNKTFDDMIYIVSDDSHLQRVILGDTKVIDAVLEICHQIDLAGYQFISIRNTRNRLWIEFKPDKSFGDEDISPIAEAIVPCLQTIKTKLKGTRIAQQGLWRDGFALRAAIVLAISSGLAVNALVHMLRLVWNEVPFLVDVWPLFYDSLAAGLLFTVIFVAVILTVLGRSARTHLVLIEVLLVGSFGATANSFVILRDLNMELDTSGPVAYQTKILDRTISRSRNSTSYYLHVIDWNNPRQREKIEVSRNFYRSVSAGQALQLEQKAGYLGYRWVSSLRQD